METHTASRLSNYLKNYIPNFSVDENIRKALCFSEKLNIYSRNDLLMDSQEIGSYWISIENTGPEGDEFLIHVCSSMTIDSYLGGSKIISSATEELHCLNEKRIEFIEKESCINEKSLYVDSGTTTHYIKIIQNSASDNQVNTFDIPIEDDNKFISEGCNILLLRYLALIDYNGSLVLNVVTIDGKIATCFYKCFNARPMQINGKTKNAYEIHQQLCESKCLLAENKYFLTRDGKILCLDWVHTDYILKSHPQLDPNISPLNSVTISLKETWRKDMEMMSKYMDKKTFEITRNENYLFLHSEIYDLISDYLQTLLCQKPDDALTFTINYFKTFTQDSSTENSPIEKVNSSESKTSEGIDGMDTIFNYCILMDDLQTFVDKNCLCGSSDKKKSEILSISKNSICSHCSCSSFE